MRIRSIFSTLSIVLELIFNRFECVDEISSSARYTGEVVEVLTQKHAEVSQKRLVFLEMQAIRKTFLRFLVGIFENRCSIENVN